MARLRSKHKEFIVKHLAEGKSPSEVRDAFEEEYGTRLELDQIVFYNPETANGAERLSDKWKQLYYRTRERWLNDTSRIPAAHKAYRIRDLAEAAREAKRMGNYPLMAKMHEQIAKEMGGAFTNVRLLEHSGRDGGPIEHALNWETLTDEQLERLAHGDDPNDVLDIPDSGEGAA